MISGGHIPLAQIELGDILVHRVSGKKAVVYAIVEEDKHGKQQKKSTPKKTVHLSLSSSGTYDDTQYWDYDHARYVFVLGKSKF